MGMLITVDVVGQEQGLYGKFLPLPLNFAVNIKLL